MGGRSGMGEVFSALNAPAIEERGLSLYSLTIGDYRSFVAAVVLLTDIRHRDPKPGVGL